VSARKILANMHTDWKEHNTRVFAAVCRTKGCMIDRFGGEYYRGPGSVDLQCLLQIGEDCGIPGMLDSISCMH
jgi:hypothetical protein